MQKSQIGVYLDIEADEDTVKAGVLTPHKNKRADISKSATKMF